MKTQSNLLSAIGLAIGALLGMSGLFFTSPQVQLCLFVISGLGFTTGLILIAVKFLREQHDLLAAGFLLFAIGEAISTLSAAAERKTSDAAFAGCMLFYFVGFMFICLTPKFKLWSRVTGIVSAVIFLIAAARFYLGYGIDTADTLPGIGYGLLTLTIVGWIMYLLQERGALSKTGL